MAQVAFDTLAYANKLKKAGCDPKLAEVQAEAQAELLGEFMQNHLATKHDIKDIRLEMQDIRLEIQSVRADLSAEIQSVRADLSAEIQSVRTDLGAEIHSVKVDIEKIKIEIKHLPNLILVRMGGLVIAALAVMTGLIKFLHL
jgi:peptidoglycan hydrolase CwlO-like protein